MDTDELSKEAYKAVMVEAENCHPDLTLQFGLLSDECADESDFLKKAIKLIRKLKKLNIEDYDRIFFDTIPEKALLDKALDKILDNIAKVSKISMEKRHFDF